MKTVAVVAVGLLLSGCAVMSEEMVNPSTGMSQKCESFGFGIIGTPIAIATQLECEKKLKEAGFVPSQGSPVAIQGNAKRGSIIFKSDPPGAKIYAGPDEANITKSIGETPFTMPMPPTATIWLKECYRMSKDGYFDSEPSCWEPTAEDRIVTLKLSSKG